MRNYAYSDPLSTAACSQIHNLRKSRSGQSHDHFVDPLVAQKIDDSQGLHSLCGARNSRHPAVERTVGRTKKTDDLAQHLGMTFDFVCHLTRHRSIPHNDYAAYSPHNILGAQNGMNDIADHHESDE